MKIRPLQKETSSGYSFPGCYFSYDGNWLFMEKRIDPAKRNSPEKREWMVYQAMQDEEFYIDTPYFFKSYPTLKSLIKALEKAKP